MNSNVNTLQPLRYIGERIVWGSMKYFDIGGKEKRYHLVIRIFIDDDIHSFRFFKDRTYNYTTWDVKRNMPKEARGQFEAFDSLKWNWEERLKLRGGDLPYDMDIFNETFKKKLIDIFEKIV